MMQCDHGICMLIELRSLKCTFQFNGDKNLPFPNIIYTI